MESMELLEQHIFMDHQPVNIHMSRKNINFIR